MPLDPRAIEAFDPRLAQAARINELEARLEALERITRKRIVSATGAGTVDLGAINGDKIAGVRLSIHGIVHAGNANKNIWLRVNGMTSYTGIWLAHRTYWPAGPNVVTDTLGGGAIAAGLPGAVWVGNSDWNADNHFNVDGTFFTRKGNAMRGKWLGSYLNQDVQNNSHQYLRGNVISLWEDSTTVVASLAVYFGGGTFDGDIAMDLVG